MEDKKSAAENPVVLDSETVASMIELAVVNAINVANASLGRKRIEEERDQLKLRLMKHVKAVIPSEGWLVLELDVFASMREEPLYGMFAAAWRSRAVQLGTLSLLRACGDISSLKIEFD